MRESRRTFGVRLYPRLEIMKSSIIYLDDEVACLQLFEEMFGDEYDVRIANTADEARRMLAERVADIVISDQRMPDIQGTDFLREVAAKYRVSHRVMLTGNAIVGELLTELGDGTVHSFVAKPWTFETIEKVIERAKSSA